MTRSSPPMAVVVVCSPGCCPGCQGCYGAQMGCHQQPCRCNLPCTCRREAEDVDPGWQSGCERHDDTSDGRRAEYDHDPNDDDNAPNDPLAYGGPCAWCGETGPCGYDDQGRPLIHPCNAEDADQ